MTRVQTIAGRMTNAWIATLASLVAIAVLVFLLAWNPEKDTGAAAMKPLTVYCAPALKAPMEVVARKFEESYHIPVELHYGASEDLLNKIVLSRRGDLYLPADDSYLDLARTRNLLAEALPLANMRPVLAVHKGNPKNIQSIKDLMRADVAFASTNEDAAIGKVTHALLRKTGEWQELERHVKVDQSTVTHVANAIKLQSVDAGFIWDAMRAQYPELETVPVPSFKNAVTHVAIGVLKTSEQPEAALRFARYVTARDQGLEEFRRFGYETVAGETWRPQE